MANLEELSQEKDFTTINDITYRRIKGRFSGETRQGEYSVPYEMTLPLELSRADDRVVLEPPHFAEGTLVLKSLTEEFLFGRGFSHASVGYGFRGLRILDPRPGFDILIQGQPYPGPDSIVDYEIIAQFATALRSMSRGRKVYGAGLSDSGAAVRRVLMADFGQKVFNLSFPGLTSPFNPVEDRGKVLVFNSEFDYAPVAVTSPNYRRYAFAGGAHIPDNKASRPAEPLPPDSPVPSVAGTSSLDWYPFFKALLIAGDKWVRQGIEPPASNVLKLTPSGNIARDEMCNAIGGVRHPALQLSEARFIDSVVRGNGWTLFGAYGNVRRLALGEFQSYLDKFTSATEDLVQGRYLLQEDAIDWVKKAGLTPESGNVPGRTFTQNYMAGLFDEIEKENNR